MARDRDYAAEYQARKAKAAREGRDLASARGHRSREYERQQTAERKAGLRKGSQLRYLEARTRFNVPAAEYRIVVDSAVDRVGLDRTLFYLRKKWQSATEFMARVDEGMDYHGEANSPAARGSLGQARYYDFKTRDGFVPIEIYWYHGYY